MEITCNRCQQAIQAESCYCPACGLPQLVYPADGLSGQASPERWDGAPRDAGSVDWKPALRAALRLAVPAGILCALLFPLGFFLWLLMGTAAAWVVALYVRSQRPAWITLGAGARIGLVTGLVGGWTAAATAGAALFALRFFIHQGSVFDDFWQNLVNQQIPQQYASMGVDAQTIGNYQKWLLTSEGRAGFVLSAILLLGIGMILFSIAGGALGARLSAGARRPEP